MAINAVPASPNANSYLTLEEANEKLVIWSDLNWKLKITKEKETLLRLATTYIERLPFVGEKLYKGQSLNLPRKIARYKPYSVDKDYFDGFSLKGNILKSFEEESFNIAKGDGSKKDFEIDLDVFPIANSINIKTIINSSEFEVTDDGNGKIIHDGNEIGTISYDTGLLQIQFPNPPDTDKDIVLKCNGYYRNIITIDKTFDAFDDFLKYGAIHIDETGNHQCFTIISNSISEKTITFDGKVSKLLDSDCKSKVIYPLNDAKEAQIIQLLYLQNILTWDASSLIRSKRIGDVAVSYYRPNKLDRVAAKFNVHPQVIALLAPYLIYGKLEVQRG